MADNAKRRAELEAELAALDSDDDGDDESELTVGGVTFRGTMRRIRDFAAANGVKLQPDPAPDADVKSGAKVTKKDDDTVRRFSGRRIS